ncbi:MULTISPECIES: hypothetical protein [Calothrix]|uniref:Cyanobacterial aminoacyl-tRNA synthetase CAAD domain-containing protein n=2 Tax=Calothrix TaxID=1186 RepID=A0ABR8AIN1_9CYAN|nr:MULTISPECIES: hypothetical protein [Calothrix]MBD2199380.1 hypothetical protein [Calothrix parietina FACHB-288]MBD2228080.1 hypothetical protein [Calothrix anomala FACHB-343]
MQETVAQPIQESLRNLPVLYKQDESQIIQHNPIQQAIQLWANISDRKTVEVYQQAAGKTWDLLKQALAVIFFLCQLLIALIIWISGFCFQMGQIFRNKLEVEQPTLEQTISTLFQFLLWPLARTYDWADSFVKKYLGWDNPISTTSSAIKPKQTTTSGDT